MKIKISTFFSLLLLMSLSINFAFAQGTHKAVKLGTSSAQYGYYEYLPTNFNKNSGKYPLLIFLHGAGEKGNGKDQLNRAIKFGPGKEVENGKNFPFVILSPQTNEWWDAKKLNDLISLAIKNYNIDENRIYMTGLSMGAMGTFHFAANFPDRLAAMVGYAGKADNSKVCRYSHVPLWAFHGDKDPTVHVSGSQTLVDTYNKCNPKTKAKLTILAGQKHWGWNEIYGGTSRGDIYGWMLQHSKNGKPAAEPVVAKAPNKAPVANAGSDKSVTLPQGEISISGSAKDEDGSVKSYSWQKVSGPGVEMNGSNTATLKLKKLNAGNYVFRLTAKDNAGASASDEMKLQVKAAAITKKEESPKKGSSNKSVTAFAGSDKTLTLPVRKELLYGTAKFVNSTARSYKWEKVKGPSVNMNGSGANLTLSQLNEGEYTFRFTVENSAGQVHSDEVKLTVQNKKGSKATVSTQTPPVNTSASNGSDQGLNYSYYKIDPKKSWSKLPDFRTLKADKTGKISNFDLSPRTQNDYFAFSFDGFIKVDKEGDYFFYTYSDEGTKLYINDKLVVNNDGLHSSKVKYGRVKLGPGNHKIRVEYFENTAGERLYVSYKGPGVELQQIPESRLSTGNNSNMISQGQDLQNELAVVPEASLKLYPNPAQDQVQLQLGNLEEEVVAISILDMSGRTLYQGDHQTSNGANAVSLSLQDMGLHKGVYLMTVQGKQQNTLQSFRFIKE